MARRERFLIGGDFNANVGRGSSYPRGGGWWRSGEQGEVVWWVWSKGYGKKYGKTFRQVSQGLGPGRWAMPLTVAIGQRRRCWGRLGWIGRMYRDLSADRDGWKKMIEVKIKHLDVPYGRDRKVTDSPVWLECRRGMLGARTGVNEWRCWFEGFERECKLKTGLVSHERRHRLANERGRGVWESEGIRCPREIGGVEGGQWWWCRKRCHWSKLWR